MKRMAMRYAGVCGACSASIDKGITGWWDASAKAVYCLGCEPAVATPAMTLPPPTGGPIDVTTFGTAGGSAAKEFDRREQKRVEKIHEDHPRLGMLIERFSEPPQSTTAWKVGAAGEERIGAVIDSLAPAVRSLHDRRIPGSRANIDHIAVGPAGVFIIDAKKYTGALEQRGKRLFVGRRDQTKLVEAMHKQREVVAKALGPFASTPIRPILCFTGVEVAWLTRPFTIDSVLVTWPKQLGKALVVDGAFDAETVRHIHGHLSVTLPPGT